MMNVQATVSGDGSVLRISVRGKFDFKLLDEFRQAYSSDDFGGCEVVVDMGDVTSVDSSALGMLLLMQSQLNKRDGDVRIINSNSAVSKILRIVRFDKKFCIE